jgi:uncharacterized protein (TIGR03437 family)
MNVIGTAIVLLLLSIASTHGQQYVISTYAGGAPPGTPVTGVSMVMSPMSLGADAQGDLYFVSANCVFKLERSGIVTRLAGNSRVGYQGDGGSVLNAQFGGSIRAAVDPAGSLYIADFRNHRLRKVSPAGVITTIAGDGIAAYSGDGGPAQQAELIGPADVAADSRGNVFLLDGARIRKISAAGIISTVAGTGSSGYSGDGGPAVSAQLSTPSGIVVDSSGSIYFADYDVLRVRKISPDGIIQTVAGTGAYGHSGDGGPAINARLEGPGALALDRNGSLYLIDGTQEDADGASIRKVSPAGIITTVSTRSDLGNLWALAIDPDDTLFVAQMDFGRIGRIEGDGSITTIAGRAGSADDFLRPMPAASAQFYSPIGVAVDAKGSVYIADSSIHRVRVIYPAGIITTVAGTGSAGYSGDGGLATQSSLYLPSGVAVDTRGNVYIADHGNRRIRKVSPAGTITTVAGTGTNVPVGDVWAVATDSADNLYVADTSSQQIRRISTDGTVTIVAGDGTQGYSGDGGPATNANLFLGQKTTLATDRQGNLYFVNGYTNPPAPGQMGGVSSARVRKVSPDGVISTVAGNGTAGHSGDGGPGTQAQLSFPTGLTADNAGNLYIADADSQSIRMLSPSGIITTIAGTGDVGYTGDGGLAAMAQFNGPAGLATDVSGNLFVADQFNNAIRILQPVSSNVSITGVANAADNRAGPIAPGEIVVLSGSGLGPATLVSASADASGFFPAQLAASSVRFNGVPAALIYTSATQLAAVVPSSILNGAAQIAVTYQHQTSPLFSTAVAPSAPGIFTLDATGRGQAVAFNADGAINSPANPAKSGELVSIFATGGGATLPGSLDGEIVRTPVPLPILPVTVSVSGEPVVPTYAGGIPGQIAGIIQINFRVPDNSMKGPYSPVVVQIGNASSQPDVTIAVQQ